MSNKNTAIQKRKALKLNFVPHYYKDEFIKDCIEHALAEEMGFWNAGIPSLEGSVLHPLSKKYLMAGLLGMARKDKNAFQKEVLIQEWDDNYFEYMMQAYLITIDEEHPDLVLAANIALHKDAFAVLDHHRIFFAVRMDSGWYPGTGLQGFCNFPILKVW